MQIYNKFTPLISKNDKFSNLYNSILIPATYALRVLERNGGPLDVEYLTELAKQYKIDIEECLVEIGMSPAVKEFERIHEKIFNPNSTMQLRELFFNILDFKPTKKTEGGDWIVAGHIRQTPFAFQ